MNILLISLAIKPYTPKGVYSEIKPSLGGNIEKLKSKYSIIKNGILYCTVQIFNSRRQ